MVQVFYPLSRKTLSTWVQTDRFMQIHTTLHTNACIQLPSPQVLTEAWVCKFTFDKSGFGYLIFNTTYFVLELKLSISVATNTCQEQNELTSQRLQISMITNRKRALLLSHWQLLLWHSVWFNQLTSEMEAYLPITWGINKQFFLLAGGLCPACIYACSHCELLIYTVSMI